MYKNVHFWAKFGFLGIQNSVFDVTKPLYDIFVFSYFGRRSKLNTFGIVQSFEEFRGLKTGRVYYDQVHSYLHHG